MREIYKKKKEMTVAVLLLVVALLACVEVKWARKEAIQLEKAERGT